VKGICKEPTASLWTSMRGCWRNKYRLVQSVDVHLGLLEPGSQLTIIIKRGKSEAFSARIVIEESSGVTQTQSSSKQQQTISDKAQGSSSP